MASGRGSSAAIMYSHDSDVKTPAEYFKSLGDDGNRESELAMLQAECQHLKKRNFREGMYESITDARDLPDTFGIAMSGGGIRSASFSLGTLKALKEKNLLDRVDYFSTVSGGGYTGTGLLSFLKSDNPNHEGASTLSEALDGLEEKFMATPSWVLPAETWYGRLFYAVIMFYVVCIAFAANTVVILALSVPAAELLVFMFGENFENMGLCDEFHSISGNCSLYTTDAAERIAAGCNEELAKTCSGRACDHFSGCVVLLFSAEPGGKGGIAQNFENLIVATCVTFVIFILFRFLARSLVSMRANSFRAPTFKTWPSMAFVTGLSSASYILFLSALSCWALLFGAAMVKAWSDSNSDEVIVIVIFCIIGATAFLLLTHAIAPSADKLSKALFPALATIPFMTAYVVGKLVILRVYPNGVQDKDVCPSGNCPELPYTWYDYSVASIIIISALVIFYDTWTGILHNWTRGNLQAAFHQKRKDSVLSTWLQRIFDFLPSKVMKLCFQPRPTFVDYKGDVPLYLCNCSLNDFKRPGLDLSTYDIWTFSQYYSGCDMTGYIPTEDDTSLADGMAISASAVAVAMGSSVPGADVKLLNSIRMLLRFFSIDMGEWVRLDTFNEFAVGAAFVKFFEVVGVVLLSLQYYDLSPVGDQNGLYIDSRVNGGLIWLPWVMFAVMFVVSFFPWGSVFYHSALVRAVHQAFGLFPQEIPSPLGYLTDGGHTENMGLYSLLRRRTKRILVVDGEDDAELSCSSFKNAIDYGRNRLPYYSTTRCAFFDGRDEDLGGVDVEAIIDLFRGYLRGRKQSNVLNRGYLHLRVQYTDTVTGEQSWGDLFYVKLHVLESGSSVLDASYHPDYEELMKMPEGPLVSCTTCGHRCLEGSCTYPFHTTAHQSYSQSLHLKYKALGHQLYGRMVAESMLRRMGDWVDGTSPSNGSEEYSVYAVDTEEDEDST